MYLWGIVNCFSERLKQVFIIAAPDISCTVRIIVAAIKLIKPLSQRKLFYPFPGAKPGVPEGCLIA
jgi:hypothetical protein